MKLAHSIAPLAPDWSNTALGAQADWPPSLRLTVDIMLNSPLAMLLMWGPQQMMVYNEAYAALIGPGHLHPPGASIPAMQPAAWSWNSDAIRQAWDGHSSSYRSQNLPVWRGSAAAQQPFDLYYTPVRDGTGKVAGILCSLTPGMPLQPEAADRPLHILVVEDNADARYLVCETLRAFGHTVQAVASGEAALPELDGQQFDVLFTDVSLPGMSGVELARQAWRGGAGPALLFASGYGDQLTRNLEFPSAALQKPYDIEQLQQALNDISLRLQKQRP